MDPWILLALIAAALLGVAVLIWVVLEAFTVHMLAKVARGELEPDPEEGDDD